MATSSPIRLDGELVRAAGAVAGRYRRTVPRQIEYWAALGRAVEADLDPTALLAIQEGLARLVVEMAPSEPVSSSAVFADLERARGEGTLAARASSARVRYQAAADAPGLLERVGEDGSRVVGRFHGGRFHPRDKTR